MEFTVFPALAVFDRPVDMEEMVTDVSDITVVVVEEVTVTDIEVVVLEVVTVVSTDVAGTALVFLDAVAGLGVASTIVGGGGGGVLSTCMGTGRIRAVNFF